MKALIAENRNLFIKNFAMTEKSTINEKSMIETLKDLMTVILTLIFVLLYAAAFTGKFDPLKDNTMLLKLEPVIFILIGYYFARRPSRQNEQSLKDEIARQTQKADAAQYSKEKAQQEREILEEKIRNAKTALKMAVPIKTIANESTKTEYFKAVISILDS